MFQNFAHPTVREGEFRFGPHSAPQDNQFIVNTNVPDVVGINPERRHLIHVGCFCRNNRGLKESWNVDCNTGAEDDKEDFGKTSVYVLDIFLSIFVRVTDSRASKMFLSFLLLLLLHKRMLFALFASNFTIKLQLNLQTFDLENQLFYLQFWLLSKKLFCV